MNKLLWILLPLLLGLVAWFILSDRVDRTVDPATRAEGSERPEPGAADEVEEQSPQSPQQERSDAERPVTGRVFGPDGAPLSGAQVVLKRVLSAWPERRREAIESVFSDREGNFRFRTACDEDLAVAADHPGMAHREILAPKQVSELVLRLEPGLDVQGYVLRSDGRPAGGSLVTLEPGTMSSHRARSMRTGADGRFSFDGVTLGAFGSARLTARLSRLAPAEQSIQALRPGRPLRLQFQEQGLAIAGQVVEASDPERPVAGAPVRAYPSTAWNAGLHHPFTAKTDQRGFFEIYGLAAGAHYLVVGGDEFSTTTRVVSAGRSRAFQRFELSPKSKLGGTLIGEPSSGLELRIETNGGELARTLVGPDGRFRFDLPLSIGSARLEIIDGDLAFARSTARDLAVIVEDEPYTDLELELVQPAVLEGQVVGPDAKPLADVVVRAPRYFLQPNRPDRWVTTTNADGVYRFRGLPAGGVELSFAHDDFAVVFAEQEVGLPGTTMTAAPVTLPEAGVIRGRVTRGSEPLAGAMVIAGRGRQRSVPTISGPDGAYELRRLAPGKYRVWSQWSTLPIQFTDSMSEVEPGTTLEGVDVDFPPGRFVSGKVSDERGQPIPGAMLQTSGVNLALADSHGKFEIEVAEGDVEMFVSAPNLRSGVRIVLPADQRQVQVTLPWVPHGKLRGKVLGLPGDRPVSRAIVDVEPLDLPASAADEQRRQRTYRDLAEMPGGRLQLDLVPAGESRLTLRAPGWAPFVQDIRLSPNGELDLGSVRLEPGAEVRGVVVDSGGQPVQGAWVHLGLRHEAGLEDAMHTATDSEGRFTLGGVAPAATRIVVFAEGWNTVEHELTIPDDLLRREPLRIVFDRGSVIVVAVERGDGDSEKLVGLFQDGGLVAVQPVDSSGVVRFEGLEAGTWQVGPWGRAGDLIEVVVDGSVAEHRVELEF